METLAELFSNSAMTSTARWLEVQYSFIHPQRVNKTMRKCFSTCARILSHENPLVGIIPLNSLFTLVD